MFVVCVLVWMLRALVQILSRPQTEMAEGPRLARPCNSYSCSKRPTQCNDGRTYSGSVGAEHSHPQHIRKPRQRSKRPPHGIATRCFWKTAQMELVIVRHDGSHLKCFCLSLTCFIFKYLKHPDIDMRAFHTLVHSLLSRTLINTLTQLSIDG